MKRYFLILSFLMGFSSFSNASTANYDNMYMSYYSADDVKAMGEYAKNKKLGGFILWEFRGDLSFDNSKSLLKNLGQSISGYKVGDKAPLVMGYWSNWNLYSNDANSRAIPEPAYPVPGSVDQNGKRVSNEDFSNKLNGMNMLTYSFVEVQAKKFTYTDSKTGKTFTIDNKTPDKIGTLYFNDPWADLSKSGQDSAQDQLCEQDKNICFFALSNRNQPIKPDDGSQMGNFNAFAKLSNSSGNLGTLHKMFSVGGYGHDDSFEDTFSSPNGITNFVQSAKAIIDAYNMSGIDLDYENPSMTGQNATHFNELVKQLRQALPDKIISVTILADPDYLKGTRDGQYGFTGDTLKQISDNADHLNLMTYDFHGAFDYNAQGTGTTGFLTNLYIPEDAPTDYKFSVSDSVDAAIAQSVSVEKISIGIPAYGRALTNIPGDNNGLFQKITRNSTIPRGDLDSATCSTSVASIGANSCSGSFQYKYIQEQMLGKGFIEHDWKAKNVGGANVANGVSAFATHWAPPMPEGHTLEITNIGTGTDTAFNVSIGSFTAPDFFNLGTDKTYTAQQTSGIVGQNGLVVQWKVNWGNPDTDPHGECDKSFNFDSNTHVMVKVHPDNTSGTYVTTCDFK